MPPRATDRIDRHAKRFYLLSYCSPARSGSHKVRIQANVKNDKGKHVGKGSLEYEFEAEKFGPPPDCDPNRPPSFRLDKNLAPAREEGGSDDDGDEAEPKKKRARGSGFGKSSTPRGG